MLRSEWQLCCWWYWRSFWGVGEQFCWWDEQHFHSFPSWTNQHM